MDLIYLISRISDRFTRPVGHLFFHQNEVLSSNIDRQTVYIIMLYLNHYIKEYENGFLKVTLYLVFDLFINWYLASIPYISFQQQKSPLRVSCLFSAKSNVRTSVHC